MMSKKSKSKKSLTSMSLEEGDEVKLAPDIQV